MKLDHPALFFGLRLAAFPKRSYSGSIYLKDVGQEISVYEGRPVLWARVRIAPEPLKELRILPIGANVSVQIVCPER